MSARAKTVQMPNPHEFRADPDRRITTCGFCGLPRRNEVHDPVKVAAHRRAVAERQHAHAARYDSQEIE